MLAFDGGRWTFEKGNIRQIADALHRLRDNPPAAPELAAVIDRHDFLITVATVRKVYRAASAP
jgi:hypothetical protein